jgi:acetyl esterase/lipase
VKKLFAVFVALFLFGSLGVAASQAQQASPAAQPEQRFNIPYGPDPAQKLDLCLPPVAGTQRPAVIMIHGGYWTMGQKNAYEPLCKGAASQGMVAATIDYRLADGSEHHRWPAQLVDAQLAVRWLRSHAAEFGVNPQHICVLGDSAGAHLAIFLAVLNRTFPGDYANEIPSVSSSVACAVDNFGPGDLTADNFWPPMQQLFGVEGRSPAQERDASPLFLVGPTTAPIMIAHGRQDKAVNVDQSVQLYDRLKRAGVPTRLVLLNGGHSFEGLSPQEVYKVLQSELDFIKNPRAVTAGKS